MSNNIANDIEQASREIARITTDTAKKMAAVMVRPALEELGIAIRELDDYCTPFIEDGLSAPPSLAEIEARLLTVRKLLEAVQ